MVLFGIWDGKSRAEKDWLGLRWGFWVFVDDSEGLVTSVLLDIIHIDCSAMWMFYRFTKLCLRMSRT